MEIQSVRVLPGELPAAEEDSAAGEPSPPPPAEPPPPDQWAVSGRDWERAPQPSAPELLSRLRALQLAEPAEGPRYHGSAGMRPHARPAFPDVSYPEPLSTEESPRRRARSLPWNAIPEAEVEEDADSLLCCCKLKKKVQFADAVGLTLASVKHFLPSDEPLVPPAVLARLQSCAAAPAPAPEPERPPQGPVPAELQARLEGQRVCLEQVSASAWGVRGCVLVQEPGDGAQVSIRYTFNEWLSFLDCPASAAQQGAAPGARRFLFSLCYPPSTSLVHFAICFIPGHGQEIWDNNQGVNYTVICQQQVAAEGQPTSPQQECQGPRVW